MINWRLSLNKIPSLEPSRIEFSRVHLKRRSFPRFKRRSTPKESASMEGFFGAIASAQRVGTSLHPYLMPIWLDKSVSVWVSINALQIGIWKSMKTLWFHLSVFEILSDSWSVSVAEMGGPIFRSWRRTSVLHETQKNTSLCRNLWRINPKIAINSWGLP